ncbi:hypothetical protein GCM10010954_25620 [Halobacillus andaensis]|uniref:DUF2254 domain-containing protein n=1 Tax=Halobacillus andaensis TaxID=1176239 RepID=A0A917B6I8_HALAA|nr:DUF2254 domain-containing protein [Halobacillus andaensis]MBP2005850.1 putative membrane protein [Halobacillus andaensis]GGF25602.1 hypothetical protein GCM10010954_25620 [Halobacillus andaensis]
MKKRRMTIIPLAMRKYFQMSHRQRKYELQMTLWSMPLLYMAASILIVVLTIVLDLRLNISQYVHPWFTSGGDATQILVSALIGGILTLSAFTLNSLLVVLTNFSDQFSPRMMFNFIADKTTQHLLGIFHGSFIYVLFIFLFLTNNENEFYSAIPVMAVFLAALTITTFIFFINHAASWMQVHNFTYAMKNTSRETIEYSRKYGIGQCSRQESGDLMEEFRKKKKSFSITEAGYIQMIYFKEMIDQAKKDDIIIELHKKIGDFSLKDNLLFTYWGPGQNKINPETYAHMIEVGHKKTEIQEMKMGIMKLSEIAVKAVGNSDPQTALSTIHHISDLLVAIDKNVAFSPYLLDENEQTRIIVPREDFEYYLHKGFSSIRNAAQNNHTILTELIAVLTMLAQAVSENKHETLWAFARNITEHTFQHYVYDLDRRYYLEELRELALFTRHEKDYQAIEYKLKRTSIH